MCMRDNLGDKKKQKKNTHTPFVVDYFFFRFLFCRMYRGHFYSPLMTLPHSLHVFTGKKHLKMSTFGMETEINKWCFIKIFSKNTRAPQLWTSSVSKVQFGWQTNWQIGTQNKEQHNKKNKPKKTKRRQKRPRTNLWASVTFRVCHRHWPVLKPVEKKTCKQA